MRAIRKNIDRLLGWLLVILMGAAVLNVLWQVFTRWALQDPSSYTEELARYLLIWIGLLGAAYATGQKLHLAIDILPMMLTGRRKRALNLSIQISVIVFALAVMAIGGMRLVWLTLRFDQVSAALGIPLGYVYSVLPVSGLLVSYYALCEILELSESRGDGEPPGVPSVTTEQPDGS